MVSVVAIKVKGVVITSSPGFMPQASMASLMASVPLATPTGVFRADLGGEFFSELATSSPSMKFALFNTFFTAVSISSFMGG